jgi:hypothetical protein
LGLRSQRTIEQAPGSGHFSHSFNNMGVGGRVELTSVADAAA